MTINSSFDRSQSQFTRIDHKKQLFLDDRMIEEIRNVRRVQHHPVKHPGNPLIKQDKPWEMSIYMRAAQVVYDAEERLFKCLYEDLNLAAEVKGAGHGEASTLLYAVSKDGVTWEKPLLDHVLHQGKKTNMVVGPGRMLDCAAHSGTVLYDPFDPDKARRFKLMYNGEKTGSNSPKRFTQRSPGSFGLDLALSPNGIDWTPYPGNPVVWDWGSDVEQLTYDPATKRYVVLGRADAPWYSSHPNFQHWFPPVRPNDPRGATYPARLVYRLESDDAIHWSEPVLVSAPDKTDNLDDQHYNLVRWRVGDCELGMLDVVHNVANTVTAQLAWSYDGVNWNRMQDRRDLIPLGPPGSCDCFLAECWNPPITVGDEHWLFYGGSNIHHDWWCPALPGGEDEAPVGATADEKTLAGKTHLCLAKIGVDRWVSLSAMAREGYVQTFPVFSTGSKLIVNGRCGKHGFIAAEISDNWNNVWADFSRDKCDVFTGDAVSHVFSWQGRTGVNMIPGIVKIKFHLRDAEIFSFRIADK